MNFEQAFAEAMEINFIMDEVVTGFVLMTKTVEELEKLAEQDAVEEMQLLHIGLELTAQKVNHLLGQLYELEDREILEMLGAEVREATKGKEQYLAVAVMLTTGGAF